MVKLMSNKYDLVIVGGGTAGVSCAWNAGKLGIKTLIIERNSFLGGSITSSLVVPAMKTSNNAINIDFQNVLYKKLKSINGAITYFDGNSGWYNPELTKIALDILMKEANVDVLFESQIASIEHKNNKILSLYIDSIDDDNIINLTNELSSHIETKYLVDATGDAKICQKLNCKFLENNSEFLQPKSLRFIMSGVNLQAFEEWLIKYDTDRNVTTSAHVDCQIHLSTAYTWDSNKNWALRPLFKEAIANNELKEEDTNYFQLFSVAGTLDSIAFNAPRLIDSYKNTSEAYSEGRLAILRLSNFCKKYLPGFENAHISSIANSLGVRISNRVECEYIYKYDDLISSKSFETPVLISNYPVDIHSKEKNQSTLETVYKDYQLPIESLKVKDWDNLYVIGRCISADEKALGALRIIPSCFSMGEGLAKYLNKSK
jgi:hypothetical protein